MRSIDATKPVLSPAALSAYLDAVSAQQDALGAYIDAVNDKLPKATIDALKLIVTAAKAEKEAKKPK